MKTSLKIAVGTSLIVLFLVSALLLREAIWNYRFQHPPSDTRRANDVLKLSWEAMNFYGMHSHLPTKLSEMSTEFGAIETDPETKRPYEYTKLDPNTYRLCANFDNPGVDGSSPFTPVSNEQERVNKVEYGDPLTHGYGWWRHAAGHQCLDRSVPERERSSQ